MPEASLATRRPAGPLPLALRNPLAELILDAFDHDEARETLGALARLDEGPVGGGRPGDLDRLGRLPWFEAAPGGLRLRATHRPHREALRARAAAALGALGESPWPARGDDMAMLDRARALADHGLYFEVHELLEPWWLRARGPERVALQGLIQVAVGLQHLWYGNLAGARGLLPSGIEKVRRTRGALPLDTASWEDALGLLLAGIGTDEVGPAFPAWPGPDVPGASSGASPGAAP